MNAIPESAAARNRFPLGVLVCVFCLLDFATPFVMAASRSSADILPVIGILLGCMAGQFGLLIIGNRGASNWYFLLAACLTASVVSLLATLPCLWAGMTARNKDTATVLVAIYTLQMSLFGVIHTNRLSGGGIPGSVAVMLCLLYATPMVVILGTLHVARLSGYAFIRQRDPQAAVEGGSRFAVGDEVEDGTELAGKTIVGAGEPGYSSEKSRDA